MRIVLKKHERKVTKAVSVIRDVRDELLKREAEKGLKAPMGNVFRFKLDSVLDDLDYLLPMDHTNYGK
jgi:hypothetical protein